MEAREEWINTELWNFVHAAALELELSEDKEAVLHRNMKTVIRIASEL